MRICGSGHSVAFFITVDRSQVSFDDFDVRVFKIVEFSPSIALGPTGGNGNRVGRHFLGCLGGVRSFVGTASAELAGSFS